MKRLYVAMFSDQFFTIEAESEEKVQQLAKEKLLKQLAEDAEPFIVWEDDDRKQG